MFKFLLSRLKHASLPELVYRVRQSLRAAMVRRSVRRGRPPYIFPETDLSCLASLALPAYHPLVSRETVEAVLRGERFTLNTGRETLLLWEAVLSGRGGEVSPATVSTADLRAVWEPGRLQHVTLLLAYLSQQGGAAAEASIGELALGELLNWLDANPFPAGPHYRSAMECGLRIPVFFLALRLLKNLKPVESKRLSDAAYAHARWIEGNLSLYSSLGNHTVCESVGMVFAGAMFHRTDEGQRLLARGVALLKNELGHQILPDGGPLEQSLSYHRFVLDLYWLTVDFLKLNSLYDCADFRPRLLEGEAFLAAFSDAAGCFPPLGDSDDGHALAPGLAPERGAAEPPVEGCRSFDQSGYTVIKGAGGLRLTFDHGPLGMPPLNNHGHADALSVTLQLSGCEFLVDPGTYRYNGDPASRSYFKSTAAHNTVTIDGQDQAVQETGFIWSNPYACRVLYRGETPAGYLVQAEHDGYRRLPIPVLHRRALLYGAPDSLNLTDTFSGTGEHDFSLHFHLHPDVVVSRESGWWRLVRKESELRIRLLEGDDFELVPGWYSPCYGVKRPTQILNCRKRGLAGSVEFRTALELGQCWGD